MARQGIFEVLTGAVVLIVAAGFLAFAIVHSGRTERTGYKLYAQFDHIDGLAPGSDVRIAGVKVGSVLDTRVDPKTFLAKVTLRVSDEIHLPKDTSAAVTSDGILGGKFLNLEPGGDPVDLTKDGVITITQSSISLEQLLGKFIFSAASLTDKANAAAPDAAPKAADPPGPDQGAPK